MPSFYKMHSYLSFLWTLHSALDLKLSNSTQARCIKSDVRFLVNDINQNYEENTWNFIEAFLKYKNYYDKRIHAQPLNIGDYTFLFNYKYSTQLNKTQFTIFIRKGLHKVLKVPSLSKYIVRKTGTHKT